MKGRILICAGSDSGGGAGLQADIKTVTALGGYAMTAVTALTAQNTRGVFGIHPVPPDFVARQMRLCLDDIGADAVKTGMLATVPVIEAVAATLAKMAPTVPLVVDPVMVAKGGAPLLVAEATRALIEGLVVRATVIIPNLPEAEVLLGGDPIRTVSDMAVAARRLLALGPRAVLLKGGHLDDAGEAARVIDILAVRGEEPMSFISPRLASRSTHGTGCTLASALACGLAQGLALPDAVRRARDYVFQAIATAPGFGTGHGPLNHAHPCRTEPA